MPAITFQSPLSQAINAKIKIGSSDKVCKACSRNAIRRNPKAVPLHPNCRCQKSGVTN